jgi:hypothetical protein
MGSEWAQEGHDHRETEQVDQNNQNNDPKRLHQGRISSAFLG